MCGHHFPKIASCVSLDLKRINVSFPDVEELVNERCVHILRETIRSWVDTLRSAYAIYHCEVWQTLPVPEGR